MGASFQCQCATGYTGDNCKNCAPGYDYYKYPDCRKEGDKGKFDYICLPVALSMIGSEFRKFEQK